MSPKRATRGRRVVALLGAGLLVGFAAGAVLPWVVPEGGMGDSLNSECPQCYVCVPPMLMPPILKVKYCSVPEEAR